MCQGGDFTNHNGTGVKRQLLRHQSPITGLFPVMSTDQEVGSVRDSGYCAAAVWSLYQAYRRIDDGRVQMITSGLQIIYTQMKWLLSKIWYTMSKELIVHQIKDCNRRRPRSPAQPGHCVIPDWHIN
ncbi:hypothetical protein GQX74_009135 [Glossina fuscipes]|nr:hypothetical protein GQX74_009135 [Glossina fuscipes]